MTRGRYKYYAQTDFRGGINQEPENAQPNQLIDARNVWAPEGRLVQRPGYVGEYVVQTSGNLVSQEVLITEVVATGVFETSETAIISGFVAQNGTDDDGWDYRVELKDPTARSITVKFFTRESDTFVEMIIKRMTEVYNGPRTIVKDYDDVLTPPRVANLQPPSPKNPGGASISKLASTFCSKVRLTILQAAITKNTI